MSQTPTKRSPVQKRSVNIQKLKPARKELLLYSFHLHVFVSPILRETSKNKLICLHPQLESRIKLRY